MPIVNGIVVRVYFGLDGDTTFTATDLAEFIADREMYRDADNLPKWLRNGYGLTHEEAIGVIKQTLAASETTGFVCQEYYL